MKYKYKKFEEANQILLLDEVNMNKEYSDIIINDFIVIDLNEKTTRGH